jgi:hypothetical protein
MAATEGVTKTTRKESLRRAAQAFCFSLLLACVQQAYAQTPTLSQAATKAGITSNAPATAKNFEFYMDPSGYPRAVTTGETVFMMGSWPSSSTPTMSDDKSNTWSAIASCADSKGMTHGFFYAANAAAGTSVITETHSSAINQGVFDWAHFYNMATSSPTDGSSCKTGVAPANNNAPNITGTAYTTATAGDLILVCVYIEQSTLGVPNTISSITFPSGFTGLGADVTYGHACAYGVQATAGSFTPTFTIAQSSNQSFTIMSAAFEAGTGGTTPAFGPSITNSEMYYNGTHTTTTMNLPCPASTTAVVIGDDEGSLSAVSDSGSNSWSRATPISGNFWGPIFYANNPAISNPNTYTVTVAFGNNQSDTFLIALYCVTGTNGIDTAAKAENGSTLNGTGSGSTYGTSDISGSTVSDVPSIGTSAAGDLVFDGGAMGAGPVESCITGQCVFDYVGSTDWTNGDTESYANGDLMAHSYAPSAETVNFNFNIGSGTSSTASGMSLAFKSAASGSGAPAAPPSITATAH